jgi:hypothetical protein
MTLSRRQRSHGKVSGHKIYDHALYPPLQSFPSHTIHTGQTGLLPYRVGSSDWVGIVAKPTNPTCTAQPHHAKFFTSGSRTVYSHLPRPLT